MAMTEYESPHQKLREEFDVLLGRNNTIMREMPAYTVAQLFQLADAARRKHGVDIDEVRHEGDGRHVILMDDRSQAAVIGLDDPEDLGDLDVAMLDDRAIGGGIDV
jgi:hypothetical protein